MAVLDILEALIESNRQRVKDNEQIGRESEALRDIERARAKRRQATSTGGPKPQHRKLVSYACPDCHRSYTQKDEHLCPSKGQSRDAVGKKVGTSGLTAERSAFCVRVMDALSKIGKTVEAHQVQQLLNKNGISRYQQQKLDRLAHDFPALHEAVKAGKLSASRLIRRSG
jgi:hypothetical protein